MSIKEASSKSPSTKDKIQRVFRRGTLSGSAEKPNNLKRALPPVPEKTRPISESWEPNVRPIKLGERPTSTSFNGSNIKTPSIATVSAPTSPVSSPVTVHAFSSPTLGSSHHRSASQQNIPSVVHQKAARIRSVKISPYESSLTYHTKHKLDYGDILLDGFYDPGRSNLLLPLEKYLSSGLDDKIPIPSHVLLVDKSQDIALCKVLLNSQQLLGAMENNEQKAKLLSIFVWGHMGGSQFHESLSVDYKMEKLCDEIVREICRSKESKVVPIGLVKQGLCRHRAVLYKYLADQIGIPCTLIRGQGQNVSHNTIYINEKTYVVDLVNSPKLYEETSPQADAYLKYTDIQDDIHAVLLGSAVVERAKSSTNRAESFSGEGGRLSQSADSMSRASSTPFITNNLVTLQPRAPQVTESPKIGSFVNIPEGNSVNINLHDSNEGKDEPPVDSATPSPMPVPTMHSSVPTVRTPAEITKPPRVSEVTVPVVVVEPAVNEPVSVTPRTTFKTGVLGLHMKDFSGVVQDFPLPAEKLVLNERLGKGTFADVYRCRIFGYTCAVKIISKKSMTPQTLDLMHNEISLLDSCKTDTIVKVLGYDESPRELKIYLEYMPISLSSLISRKRAANEPFSRRDILKILKTISKALSFLHSKRIVHRDIKSSNVLLELEEGERVKEVRMCDFGVSKALESMHQTATFAGSELWAAPEIFGVHFGDNDSYDEKVDIWSFGILAVEILFLETPYKGMSNLEASKMIRQGLPPPILEQQGKTLDPEVLNMLYHCLQKKAVDRWSAEELMNGINAM